METLYAKGKIYISDPLGLQRWNSQNIILPLLPISPTLKTSLHYLLWIQTYCHSVLHPGWCQPPRNTQTSQATLFSFTVRPSESAPILVVPKLYCRAESTGGFSKAQIAGPGSASDSAGIELGPRMGISNKFPGDADACGPSGKLLLFPPLTLPKS